MEADDAVRHASGSPGTFQAASTSPSMRCCRGRVNYRLAPCLPSDAWGQPPRAGRIRPAHGSPTTATRAGRSHDDWPQEVKLLRRGSPNTRVRSGEPNGPQLASPQTLATRGEQAQAGTMEAREREPTKRRIAARERRMRPSPVSRRARVPRPLEAPASEGDRPT